MRKFFLSLTLILISLSSSIACDFKFEIQGDQKAFYKAGEEIVIKVRLNAFHPFCAEDLKNVKFTTEGVDVLGATDWQLISTGIYERKIKIKITNQTNGEAKLTATRLCQKMGGTGTIIIKTEPEK